MCESTSNKQLWERSTVVAHYATQENFLPCEDDHFTKYIPLGCKLLDVGVGAGRTTGLLAGKVARYVGIDYSAAMVKVCKQKFPHLDIREADAQDLSFLADGQFEVALFSYNGMDYLYPDRARHCCIREIRRVLGPRGRFLFSTHNPHCCLPEIDWTWRPLLLVKRMYWAMGTDQLRKRARALLKGRCFRRSFYAFDASLKSLKGGPEQESGLWTHHASEGSVVAEMRRFGFKLLEVDDGGSKLVRTLTKSWIYYSFEKQA